MTDRIAHPAAHLVPASLRLLFTAGLCALAPSMTMAAEGKLTFSTFSFPPFSYSKDGKVVGPFDEIIDTTCKKIQFQCPSEMMSNRRSKMTLETGAVNGNFPLGWNKERGEVLYFSPPLMKTEYGFFVHVDSKLKYKALADVQGMTIATFGPSNTLTTLEGLRRRMISQGLKPFEADVRPDDEAGFKKLAATRVDAVFSNREVGFAVAAKLGLRNKLRYAGKTSELNYYIGFDKKHNDPKILAVFNAAVAGLIKDGMAKKILAKYEMQLPTAQLDDAKTMTQ